MSDALQMAVEAVDSLPNLIKVVMSGVPDRVMRVLPLESRILTDNAPDMDEWEQIKRLVYLKAPVEQKGLEPVPVGTTKEWTITTSDVPVVDLGGYSGELVFNKKNRERRLGARQLALAPSAVDIKLDTPKKRGRPKGSKNKPKVEA